MVDIDHALAKTQFEPYRRYRRRFAEIGLEFRSVAYSKLLAGAAVPQADCIFLQSPYTPPATELEGVLSRIKTANPQSLISYFDWFAPLDIRMAERVDPFVDYYVKKALFKDRAEYLKPTKGHTNLTDYYEANYGTENPPAFWTVPATILNKLVVGPAFSTGVDLIKRFENEMPDLGIPRPIDIHARIETSGSTWYSFMRRHAVDAVSKIQGLKIYSAGKIPLRRYYDELSKSKLVFSPFGYGEICWRDFEAIAMGAVLVKPDMSHLEANPNIYIADETYISVKWDFSDLEHKVRVILENPTLRAAIARKAFEVVQNYLRDGSLNNYTLGLTKLTRSA